MSPDDFCRALASRWPTDSGTLLKDAMRFAWKYPQSTLDQLEALIPEHHASSRFPTFAQLRKIAEDAGVRQSAHASDQGFDYWHCRACGRYLPITASGSRCACNARSSEWVVFRSAREIDCVKANRDSGADQIRHKDSPDTPAATEKAPAKAEALELY